MKQIMPLFYCGIASLMLSACSTLRLSNDTLATPEAGLLHVTNTPAQFSFHYYGDYQPALVKQLDTVAALHPYFISISRQKPIVIFAGKTYVSPFCSTLALEYPKAENESLLAEMNHNIESVYHSKPTVTDTVIHQRTIRCIEYMLSDRESEQQYQFIEYQIPRQNDWLRLIFWSTEPDLNWLHRETIALVADLE